MINRITDSVVLNNGVKMPWLGFGVFEIPEGDELERVVRYALEAGYRHIDTAEMYGNESGVGNAVRRSGIKREDVFITTKVANTSQGYENTLKAFGESLKRLGTDYVDLYLVHRPCRGKFKDTWMACEKIYRDGYARAIGVSNFMIKQLEDLLSGSSVVPTVNQVEYHPYLTEAALHGFCRGLGIQFEAWSPLVRGGIFDEAVIANIARKYGRTAA